ncbi:MAG: serine/threonine protein kinase, partial [Catenulispora sp.]|nr:serine/threonine protein kinase [Catenulispora sp.]
MRTRSQHPPQAFHPARIGPYEVLRRLGAGAMGEVFLARSASSRLVAVKTIRAGLAEHPGYRRRFAHEVDAAKRVSGAFTAAVVGADAHADLPWLATVYVPAPSLEELVAACGPLAVSAVRWLAAGCAEALECVHRAGLVHRDFKPANVLVTADGPRVIDFGLARSDGLPQGTAAGMVLGTPLYMAPEQAAGDPATGPAADVFALGATLYHAATGAAPYKEAREAGPMLQVMSEPPDLAPVPPELRALVLACLAVEPADRPTPAGLIAALSPFLATAGAAPPLPAAVLEYIEEYRRTQMDLTQSRRRSRPEAQTLVVGGAAAGQPGADADGAAFGDGSGDFDDSVEFGGVGGFGEFGEFGEFGGSDGSDHEHRVAGLEDEAAPPGHPSLLPARALAGRAGSNPHRSSRHGGVLVPAAVAVGVTLALGGATIGGLLLAGAIQIGGDHTHSAATGPTTSPAISQSPSGAPPPAGSPPGSPPPTASPPPASR